MGLSCINCSRTSPHTHCSRHASLVGGGDWRFCNTPPLEMASGHREQRRLQSCCEFAGGMLEDGWSPWGLILRAEPLPFLHTLCGGRVRRRVADQASARRGSASVEHSQTTESSRQRLHSKGQPSSRPPQGWQGHTVPCSWLRGESKRYLAWNPGKRSLAVDLKPPQGREISVGYSEAGINALRAKKVVA